MMKDLITVICITVSFILASIIGGLIAVAIYSSVMLTGNQRLDDYDFLRETTNRFIASHKYKLNGTDKYTCINYSRDYYLTMNNLGYNVNEDHWRVQRDELPCMEYYRDRASARFCER